MHTGEGEGEGEKEKRAHTRGAGVGRGQGERKSLRTWEREGERKGEKEHMHAVVGGGGEKERAHVGERESERALGSSFCMFSPPGLPYANWAQPGVLFYLKSSLWSSDLSLTFLCSIFVVFSLPCLLAISILDSFSLFYLPNKMIMQLKLLFLCTKMEKLTLKTFFFFWF